MSKYMVALVVLLFGFVLVACGPARVVEALAFTETPVTTPTPTTPEPTQTAIPTFTPEPTPTGIVSASGQTFGLPGEVQCWNCTPFSVVVSVTNYDPMEGPINCFDYDEEKDYCYSPTSSLIHWKAVWGFGAACPMEWPIGTWVEIPNVGYFICFDRGGSIQCDPDTKVCAVDLLGPGDAWWNGETMPATIWVPLNPPRN